MDLTAKYPGLLKDLDLSTGRFRVASTTWDSLPGTSKVAFVATCSRYRQGSVDRAAVTIYSELFLLAASDGVIPIFYSDLSLPGASKAGDGFATQPEKTDEMPVLLMMPQPVYPELARKNGIDGTVRIKVLIGKNGTVRMLVVEDGGIPELNDAAIAAVREAKFKAASRRGKPLPVWAVIPLAFHLRPL